MEKFIEVKDLSFSYNDDDIIDNKIVLDNVNLTINKGEFVSVIGHNASGKSTLSKLFNAMIIPTSGKVFVDGMDTSDENLTFKIREKVGLVLQNPDNQLIASIVEEDVAFGPENLGLQPKEIRKRVDDSLIAVGMYEYRKNAPHKLSGGQKQRVSIAGIIAMKPSCIVLDEPTSMLDPSGRKDVIETIKQLNKELGITIILITHYMDEAIKSDRVIVMSERKILIDGAPREVFLNVKLLKENNLDIPQPTQLVNNLKLNGINVPCDILNNDECIKSLEEILSEYNGSI